MAATRCLAAILAATLPVTRVDEKVTPERVKAHLGSWSAEDKEYKGVQEPYRKGGDGFLAEFANVGESGRMRNRQ